MSKKKKAPPVSPESQGLPLTGVESHAHLDMDPLRADIPGVLDRAHAAGVAHVVNVFLGPDAFADNACLFTDMPQVSFILGIHPHETKDCASDALSRMEAAFAKDTRLKALGEIGLDYFYDHSPREVQQVVFAQQLELARALDLPVVIHSRDAHRDTLHILLDMGFKGRKILWHCFGGDVLLAREILGHGWSISIPGPVTYPKNQELREAVAEIPLESMVLETDCPFLAPVPYRGKTNEPALMVFTAQTVAEAKTLDIHEVWTRTGSTAREFFSL